MKKILMLVVIGLSLASCLTKNVIHAPTKTEKNDQLGIGILTVKVTDQNIPVYLSDDSNVPYDTLRIRRVTDGIGKGIFTLRTSLLKNNFQPYWFYGGHISSKNDYLKDRLVCPVELEIRVINNFGNNYHVITNENIKQVAVVKQTNDPDSIRCSFESWSKYFEKGEYINPYFGHPVLIYNHPNGKVIDHILLYNQLKIINLQGYWLLVNYPNKAGKKNIGWLVWRNDDNIILKYLRFQANIKKPWQKPRL